MTNAVQEATVRVKENQRYQRERGNPHNATQWIPTVPSAPRNDMKTKQRSNGRIFACAAPRNGMKHYAFFFNLLGFSTTFSARNIDITGTTNLYNIPKISADFAILIPSIYL